MRNCFTNRFGELSQRDEDREMKNTLTKAFLDGFIGSFVIAAVVLLAIPRAVSELVNHRPHSESTQDGVTQ
jgi:hypothetical protein